MAVQQAESATESAWEYGAQEEKLDLDAWREQVERARKESASAYVDFLDSLFSYYRESVRAAEKSAREGESAIR